MDAAQTPKSRGMQIESDLLHSPRKRAKYTVCVIGCGRIGLPTACIFAEAGFRVIGADADSNVVSLLKKGKAPFVENGLSELVKKHAKSGRFTATTDVKNSVSESDIITFIVPTVIDEKKKPDYSHVEKACKEAGMGLRRGSLVIFASTIGSGLTETLVKETLEKASGLKAGTDFGLVNSPTRAAPGQILQDIISYPRVIGAINEQSLKAASLFFGTFVKGGIVEVHDLRTAEVVKLFENVFRDVSLALANDFALFCEKAKIDYLEAQGAANTQPYCHLPRPGIVAGHIPKDPYLLLEEAENASAKLSIVALARKINDEMLEHAVQLVREGLSQNQRPLRRAKITLLGVSYKANIKEPRGSATSLLVKMLSRKGSVVKVFDPLFSTRELREMGYPAESTLLKAVEGADCIVVIVGHTRFRHLNLKKLRLSMTKAATIIDMGLAIDPQKAEKEGFVYRAVGGGAWAK
jgi:UDP-N-acetyl-D-mannosaminuronic acid dehydrogenase